MARRRAQADHPNLEVARGLWSAAADGDADAVQSYLADEVVWTTVGRNPLSGVRHGPDQVLDYLALVGETAEEFSSRMDDVLVSDQGAVITYHVTARRGDKRLEMDYFLMLRVDAGKVASGLMVPVDQYDNDDFWT